jgi:[ribosomal protein S5]-alanine N-acetyltransferase
MEQVKLIKCNGFILRPWRRRDKRSLVKHANNKNVSLNLMDVFPNPYSEEDAYKWFNIVDISPVNTLFAIVVERKAVGGIGIHFKEDVRRYSAELGYWLGEEYWGRGIATESVKQIIAFSFKNFDINRLYASVFDWNLSSVRVLEKNNFKLEGILRKSIFKNGVYADELVYGLLREDVT